MNLENFPTSGSAQKMLRMVSNGFYDDSYVGKWIYQVIGAKFDTLQEKLEDLPLQAYLDTATWGLAFWEQLTGLPVREDLAYEARRVLIKEKMDNRHPASPAWLSQYMTMQAGCPVGVDEIPLTYMMSVRIRMDDAALTDLDDLEKKLTAVKPAHMGFGFALEMSASQEIYFGNVLASIGRLQIGCESPEAESVLDAGTLDSFSLG